MNWKVRVTRHARQRLHEREGIGKGSVERRAQLALDRGYHHCQTKGRLKKWMNEQWEYRHTANGMRVYGDKLYIFSGSTLVTVLQIPAELTKDLKKRYIK